MAYNSAAPPACLAFTIGDEQPQLWVYQSTDAPAAVAAAGYISNAKPLGMKVGDVLFYFQTSGPANQIFRVASFTGNAANLSAGIAIT